MFKFNFVKAVDAAIAPRSWRTVLGLFPTNRNVQSIGGSRVARCAPTRVSRMSKRVRLLSAQLHYGANLKLHTATSGQVPFLDELYLLLEDDHGVLAVGGTRINIEYLTGIPAPVIKQEIIDWASNADWSQPCAVLIERLHGEGTVCPPARALIDQTLHDGVARAKGLSISGLWDRSAKGGIASNQSLSWCDDETLVRRTKGYLSRGFKHLKLRLGVAGFEDDLRRLDRLRDEFGDTIKLSGDVNGQWPDDVAVERIGIIERFELEYLEQPVSPSNWPMIEELARTSSIKIMLDEAVSSDADVERIVQIGGKLAAHLKLTKFGGLRPLVAAGQRLIEAGVPVMIGQMNEGALATAAAAHAAAILGAQDNELYGADGIVNDPGGTPRYADGKIFLPAGPGAGPTFDASRTTLCWERQIEPQTRNHHPSLQHT